MRPSSARGPRRASTRGSEGEGVRPLSPAHDFALHALDASLAREETRPQERSRLEERLAGLQRGFGLMLRQTEAVWQPTGSFPGRVGTTPCDPVLESCSVALGLEHAMALRCCEKALCLGWGMPLYNRAGGSLVCGAEATPCVQKR